MFKLYIFSEESVRKANAAYELGFDIIGKEEIPVLEGRHTIIRTYMKNVNETCYINNDFFPEIEPGVSLSVHYIANYKECNKVYHKANVEKYRKFVLDNDSTTAREKNQAILNDLSKRHAIWIRDVHSQEHQYRHGMPWPKANIYGKYLPMTEFIEFFNEKYAHEGFDNAIRENPNLLDMILKDYFVQGEEGFHFPVSDDILSDDTKFSNCLIRLYKRFPHLDVEGV